MHLQSKATPTSNGRERNYNFLASLPLTLVGKKRDSRHGNQNGWRCEKTTKWSLCLDEERSLEDVLHCKPNTFEKKHWKNSTHCNENEDFRVRHRKNFGDLFENFFTELWLVWKSYMVFKTVRSLFLKTSCKCQPSRTDPPNPMYPDTGKICTFLVGSFGSCEWFRIYEISFLLCPSVCFALRCQV